MITTENKYLFFLLLNLCVFSYGKQRLQNNYVWNADLYAQGNTHQERIALKCLEYSSLSLHDKYILDIGSGTGNISYIMAQQALSVIGIDADNNMVQWAQKQYKNIPNLSFYYCYAEELDPSLFPHEFNIITAFNCIGYFTDQLTAFKKIYECLGDDGEFLSDVGTYEDVQKSVIHHVLREEIPKLYITFPSLQPITMKITNNHLTNEEYKALFEDNGFNIILFKKIKDYIIFKNKDEIITMQKPILMSRPFMQQIPENMRYTVFMYLVDKIAEKLELDENNNYLYPINVTIIHARKKYDT